MWGSTSGYRLPENLKNTILGEIVRIKIRDVEGAKVKLPAVSLEAVMDRAPETRSLKRALMTLSPAVIAEIKKASPSAGSLREDFDALRIGDEYEEAGAAAISVLTEGRHFQGNLETLARLRWRVKLPLLRKDFIIDPYQVLESRHAGADALLLITALLETDDLKRLRVEAERLGMDALVEVHDEEELRRALDAGASLIGVNSRNLRTFEVSLDVALNFAPLIPKDVVAVAESGIHSAQDLRRLSDAGYRGFLIGEHFMRAASPGAALNEMVQAFRKTR